MERSELLYDIWLTQIKGIGSVAQHRFFECGLTPEKIYQMVESNDLVELEERGVPKRFIQQIKGQNDLDQSKQILEQCGQKNIRIITMREGKLPDRFREYDTLPLLLYAKGRRDIPLKFGVGIVGARRCTPQAKAAAIDLALDAIRNEDYVISGMAKGIDSYAHTTAVKDPKGITIAVLGNGPDVCYPSEHRFLMDAIQSQGMTLSEYPPGTTPRKFNFPQRNRIIAALSKRLYVIGAGQNSGTRTTIEAAVKYGIQVDADCRSSKIERAEPRKPQ